ncbi:hypothetical protein EMPS_00570 [Entomortierella parvispora]|uniref:Pentacotripeptide-repeat region of PRORP domain-containing protein n=1 Tax=Entomortierella parvispora TaxID=205924 RepID=A0A9P3H1B4_9FUNG|nr:hypothetical protein EMPS_00570 [Entomortierella parvispora]
MSSLALGLRLRQLRLASVASRANFSQSSLAAAASIEKKSLNKKITLPKDPYLLSEKVVKFARNGKLDDAIALVLEAPKTRQNEVVWNHLIQESAKLGKASQSWQLLNDMKKRGIEPNARTFTILLNALAINSDSPNTVARAKELYTQMQESEDNEPELVHTNAFLKVCSRAEDLEAMKEIYDTMPKSGPRAPDVVTYNILINAYARKGGNTGFDLAWKTWEDFLEARTKRPDELDLDPRLVDAVLLACRQATALTLIKRGYKLVESLYGLELPSTTASASGLGTKESKDSTATMSAAERALSPSKGFGLGAALRRDVIQCRTVELLLSLCLKLRDFSRAQQYLDHIQTVYPDFKPDSQLLSSVMHFQVASKNYEAAIATWDKVTENNLRHSPATLKQGLDAALKDRNWPKAMEMYTEQQRLIRVNKKAGAPRPGLAHTVVTKQDAWTLASVLKCAVKTKHLKEGFRILEDTHWTRVVKGNYYPRANVDVAEQAVKIYTSVLASEDGEMEKGKLERRLEEAKTIKVDLDEILAKYDASKKAPTRSTEQPEKPRFAPSSNYSRSSSSSNSFRSSSSLNSSRSSPSSNSTRFASSPNSSRSPNARTFDRWATTLSK